MLASVGFGAFHLLNKGTEKEVKHLVLLFNLDEKNTYISKLIHFLVDSNQHLNVIAIATFVYSLLYLIEGVGLLKEKRWAEYFTLGITASLLPFEIYELFVHVNLLKIAALTINIIIVIYLAYVLYRTAKRHKN